jgi:putative membrane protein
MLIKHKLTLRQIFYFTWKVDLMLLICCTIVYFIDTYWLSMHISIPVAVSAVLGTAIAFFIGFNNNQAYDRWWEARIIWGGLVNDSRSWARSLLYYNTLNSHPDTPYDLPAPGIYICAQIRIENAPGRRLLYQIPHQGRNRGSTTTK